jgi:hypothetical protein
LAPFIKLPFEQERWRKLRAISLGAWHGTIGRTGKLSDGIF